MLTIPNLVESLRTRLGVQAAAHGHSMEGEASGILRGALSAPEPEPSGGLASRPNRRFVERSGAIELAPPARAPAREPPSFEEPE